VRILVDTGVFSASISRRRRARFERQVGLMAVNQIFLADVTVAELRYGALVAGWEEQRRQRLEQAIAATTVVPVSDALLTTTAELRHACRQVGRALHEPVHANDLWIAASAVHIGAPLLTGDAVFDDVPGLSLHSTDSDHPRSDLGRHLGCVLSLWRFGTLRACPTAICVKR
jgi:predicted nucleic acid-binding protein